MKVTIFTGSISLDIKNPDVRKQYIIQRLKYFTQDDISIELITPKVDECLIDLPQNIKYNMYRFIDRKHLKTASVLAFSVGKLLKLNRELIHCYTYQAAILAWLTNNLKKNKCIIIFEPMGLLYEELKLEENHLARSKMYMHFVKFIERLIFRKSNSVIVYTQNLKKYLSKNFDIDIEKIHVIPHGTSLDTLYKIDQAKISSVYEKLNIPKTNRIAVYTGSLSELHGTQHLIKAINYVSKKRQDISFLILGKGVLEDTLKKNVEENDLKNVYLLGFVSQEDIRLYLSLADILLIPHAKCMQTELDQPTKLFEYLDSGKPIVSFNLKAIAEVVGKNAILVEPDNPKALADGILSLADDEKLRRRLGTKGKIIANNYSWEMSAKKQYELYLNSYKEYKDTGSVEISKLASTRFK